MTATYTVAVDIANIIPSAGDNETGWILSLWEGANQHLKNANFKSEDPYRSAVAEFQVSLQLDDVVALMKKAQTSHGSFANYLQAAQQPNGPSTASRIVIELQSAAEHLDLYSLYNAVGTLLHQLVLAFNIALPGSFPLIGARYQGPDTHRFEAPQFSADLFTNAWLSAFDANWPTLKPLSFSAVWKWLAARRTSETDVAMASINKVLFGLLELAQHRYMSRHRDGMLVAHMIEILMKVSDGNVAMIRERVSATLGKPTEKADSFNELYRLKDSLLRGDYPVRRPALIVHEADDPVLQQLEIHNSPVEQGAAIVLAMLQDLVENSAAEYQFTQYVNRI